MIVYNIDLCIGRDDPDKKLTVKCHDTGAKFRAHLYKCRAGIWRDEHVPYKLPKGVTAIFKIAKPDNTYCVNDAIIENTGTVLLLPEPQAFTAPGMAKAEIQLFNAEGKRITTATFYIDITAEALCDCERKSESYVDVFAEQLKAATEAADKIAEDAAAGKFNGKDGYTPVKGMDYCTPEEKAELVDEVLGKISSDNILKDRITGKKYILYVENGDLKMKGSEE